MTNIKKYAMKVLDISIDGQMMGLKNNEPIACGEYSCDECELYRQGCCYHTSEREYASYMRSWAATEYVESPKLTLKERQFCELVENGWIVRDEYGYVYWFMNKPYKKEHLWGAKDVKHILCINEFLPMLKFEFISWEDEEPWSVENLLKLEVEE